MVWVGVAEKEAAPIGNRLPKKIIKHLKNRKCPTGKATVH